MLGMTNGSQMTRVVLVPLIVKIGEPDPMVESTPDEVALDLDLDLDLGLEVDCPIYSDGTLFNVI